MTVSTDLKSINIESDEIDVFIELINQCDYSFLQNYKLSERARFYKVLYTFLYSSMDCINFIKD